MATPREALEASQTININDNAHASPRNQSIGNQDTVAFKNNSPVGPATVTFLGAGAGEFGIVNLTISPGTTCNPLTPLTSNVTVDYNVTVGNSSGGPFSIQVGSGPLQIDIVNVAGNTDLPTAAIPNNGTVTFSNLTTGTAYVTFLPTDALYDQNGSPVSEQVVSASTLGAPLTGRGTNKNVSYWVTVITQVKSDRVETGNGTIKIGQT